MLSQTRYWAGLIATILLPGLGHLVISEWKWGGIWLLAAILAGAIGAGLILSGAVIIETVFTYPGIGRLVVRAVQQRDYNLVQGVLLVVTGIYVIVNLLVDLSYGLFDPRIRYD